MKVVEGYVCLKDVRFRARHGVMEQERATGGDFVLNLRIAYPLDMALKTDNVGDTINYAEVLETVELEMREPSCLLEHVAGRIGESLFRRFPKARTIDVSLAKINPPTGHDVASAAVELRLINDKTV